MGVQGQLSRRLLPLEPNQLFINDLPPLGAPGFTEGLCSPACPSHSLTTEPGSPRGRGRVHRGQPTVDVFAKVINELIRFNLSKQRPGLLGSVSIPSLVSEAM